ncbi:MAG: RluA family pseudouridine synthase [bacterium]|nr:MAG: RluA family pseudouridine synthase [bacterium]
MREFIITEEWSGARIDRFVRTVRPGIPFHAIQMLLRKGRILLNGKRVEGKRRLSVGDTVTVDMPEPEGVPAGRTVRVAGAPGWIGDRIEIIYEDEDCLVINKPAGIVVQPGNRKERGSILDLLEVYRRRIKQPADTPFPYSPVHRLDMRTTGALVVAKGRAAARTLAAAFASSGVEKEYLAVIEGIPGRKQGTIAIPLRTRKGTRSRTRSDATGKEALTRYRLLKRLPGDRALVSVTIETGRTHQIRAHLSAIGHPLAGDRYYGARTRREGGFLLHAWRITFPHPRDGRPIEIEASPPEEIAEYLHDAPTR